MSTGYKAVLWNRQKQMYDLTLGAGVVLYLALFLGVAAIARPNATVETLLIRALGTGAFLLLHVVLSIGPLCRLDRRFLPLLYNRRHLGVITFTLGLAHAALSLFQFHALSENHPLVNLLSANTRFDSLAQFPFQLLGAGALVILFLMAATSHDFWLANLTAPVWKRLHMLVYAAYALLVGHVVLGVLQAETSPWLAGALVAGTVWVLGLHLLAGWRERRAAAPRASSSPAADGFVEVCGVEEIVENRGRVVSLGGERVAVFRYDGKISALSNVCQHQNGPLGEGRILNGCAVCPWHGYEYLPDSGQSPPPFTEKLPTFRTRVENGRVWVHPRPLPAGTRVEPAAIGPASRPAPAADEGFYVGYRPAMAPALARSVRLRMVAVFAVAVAAALVFALRQQPFAAAEFEFGHPRAFAGGVAVDPYPVLELEDERLLLLGPGKTGADDEVAPLAGDGAALEGTLIRRPPIRALEIVRGSAQAATGAAASPQWARGRHTLRGEIVDSKCYLGVMKPGRGKPHRACAVNCIRGGAPPALVVTDENGRRGFFLLADAGGGAVNDRVLDLVGEPLEISGEVVQRGNLHYLLADPGSYRRLDAGR